MTDTPKTPERKVGHDEVFRALVETSEHAAILIRETLPPALAARMADTPPELLDGTYIDESSRLSQSDRLFRIALTDGSPALVYTLLEHKSEPDPGTPLQLLHYMVRIWRRYAEDKAERLRALPPIVPMVYYHGASRWTVPEGFADIVQADEDTAPFVPAFRYLLRDLGVGPIEALSTDPKVRAALAALRLVLRSKGLTQDNLELILSVIDGPETLKWVILRYVSDRFDVTETVFRAALDAAGVEEEIMGTLAEKWIEEGEARGVAKGLAEGKAHTLTRLLRLRFGELPETVPARIASASLDELERWTDHILTAADLDDVFGDGNAHR